MKIYSQEFKEQMVAKMLNRGSQTISELANEAGVSPATLHNWARQFGANKPVGSTGKAKGLSSQEKLDIINETASLNEEGLAGYCREKGLFAHEIAAWRQAACIGMDSGSKSTSKPSDELAKQKRVNKKLTNELRRKEKALAEAAALLVLRKKAQAIWGEEEED